MSDHEACAEIVGQRNAEIARLTAELAEWKHIADHDARISADLRARVKALEEALTSSGDTKADYHGDFVFEVYQRNVDGEDYTIRQTVPWKTIKEIMVRISERAARAAPGKEVKP